MEIGLSLVSKLNDMTQFEQSIEQVAKGALTAPHVSIGSKVVDYFWYQLVSHHFYMKIFAAGMTAKQANLKTYKAYYGLKSRTAKDCLIEFETLMADYKAKHMN